MNIMQMFLDGNNDVSSMRTVMIVLCGTVIVKYIAFNVSALIHGLPPIPFDPTDIAMMASAFAGKVTQSITENKKAV